MLLIGVTFALVFLLAHIDGGLGAIFTAFTADHKFLAVDQPIFDINILKDSVFIMIVGAGFNTMGSYVSSQDIVQRFTTTTDTKKLNKMMLTNGALSIFIATVFYLIGTGLYVFYQQNALPPAAAQDQIFASYIAFELPVGITGLLLAAIYAASQSTLSTGLNSVAASWTLDIQARLSKKELSFEKQTKIGQYVSLIVGIFSIVVAMVLANGGVEICIRMVQWIYGTGTWNSDRNIHPRSIYEGGKYIRSNTCIYRSICSDDRNQIFRTGRVRNNLVLLTDLYCGFTCCRNSGKPDLEKGKRRYLRAGSIYNRIQKLRRIDYDFRKYSKS